MPTSLDESYAYCQSLAKRTARNFYYSFLALPAEQYRAMCALYAFMRITDDWSDDDNLTVEQKTLDLMNWRRALLDHVGERAQQTSFPSAENDLGSHPVWPAVRDIIARYHINVANLRAVIDGVELDLTHAGYESFAELAEYCRLVAGVIGLCCLPIWGCHDPAAEPLALSCGLAFQLTNILRDLGEDAQRGRCYLPREDLRRFGYPPEKLVSGEINAEFQTLMRFEVDRARMYYRHAEHLTAHLNPGGKAVFQMMFRVYSGLLDEIEHRHYDVFSQRVTIPAWKKYWWLTRSLVQHRLFAAPARS
ncbi:MAG: phytoene/squalene synthase family protein [Planctomycetaceae bacterium]